MKWKNWHFDKRKWYKYETHIATVESLWFVKRIILKLYYGFKWAAVPSPRYNEHFRILRYLYEKHVFRESIMGVANST